MVDKVTTKLLLAFVTLLIGIVLIGTIGAQTALVTTPTTVLDESVNISTARLAGGQINQSRTYTLANLGSPNSGGWVTNSVTITNSTGSLLSSGNYSVSYTLGNQSISFLNTTTLTVNATYAPFQDNITLIDYQYYPSGYVSEGWSRTSLNTVGGFFALALMLVAVGLFYSVGKDFNFF